jgi:protein SCO1/2
MTLARGLASGVLVLVPLVAACSAGAPTDHALPYYESADFTPHWTTSTSREIADFSLTAQTGARVTRADLLGRVHIANFMFTKCPTLCPLVMRNLKRVQDAVGSHDIQLVSYSVTPETDTPAQLAAFGASLGVDPAKWRLLTGDRRTIYALARRSYFADDSRVVDPGAILHSEKVLLVDRDGRLRGVYNGSLSHEMDELIEDARLLAR